MEGKLEWDAPVIRYLPQFAMYDPFVTRELTVRDLLVHRSGLDFSFYALGLEVVDYRSRRMLRHAGGLPGYVSSVAFIPSARAAVVVLTNDESPTFLALTWALMD